MSRALNVGLALGAGAGVLALLALLSAGDDGPPAWPWSGPILPPDPDGDGVAPTAAELLESLPPLAENQWSQELKVAAADPRLRLSELLGRLRDQGWQPRIVYSWRSLLSQERLFAEGYTQVTFSFHNAVDDQGYPAGLAADIIDSRYGFGDGDAHSAQTTQAAAFARALGREGEALGLTWGGRWKQSTPLWAAHGLGWDPMHVQGVPNDDLFSVRRRCVPLIFGGGLLKVGSGGYTYRQWPNGWVQIAASPGRDVGEVVPPLRALAGVQRTPQNKGLWRAIDMRQKWSAITSEIGPYSEAVT